MALVLAADEVVYNYYYLYCANKLQIVWDEWTRVRDGVRDKRFGYRCRPLVEHHRSSLRHIIAACLCVSSIFSQESPERIRSAVWRVLYDLEWPLGVAVILGPEGQRSRSLGRKMWEALSQYVHSLFVYLCYCRTASWAWDSYVCFEPLVSSSCWGRATRYASFSGHSSNPSRSHLTLAIAKVKEKLRTL